MKANFQLRRKIIVSLTACMSVLLPTVLATGCFPGSSVYDGPLKEVTDVVLVEGKEYLAYFKSPGTGIGGSSTSDSAHRYPTLGSVVIIYDDTGIIIPNTITSGEVSAYWGEKGSGITVAQFRLEGEDTQRIELRIDMDAYREFATSYNKGRRTPPGPGGGIEARAPSQPSKLVIRRSGSFSFGPGPVWLVGFITLIAFMVYGLIRWWEKRARSRATD